MNTSLVERGLQLGGSALLLYRAMRARTGLGRLTLAAAAGGLFFSFFSAASGRGPLHGLLGTGANVGASGQSGRRAVHLTRTITIACPPEVLYRFWRNFENLPRIMRHLESVRTVDARRSRWRARAPLGTSIEWSAEVTHEIPNSEIGWRSLPGSQVASSGIVRFRPSPDGQATQLQVEMRYAPPAGQLGEAFASLLGENPQQQLDEDLQSFKQAMEGAGIPTVGPESADREIRTT